MGHISTQSVQLVTLAWALLCLYFAFTWPESTMIKGKYSCDPKACYNIAHSHTLRYQAFENNWENWNCVTVLPGFKTK